MPKESSRRKVIKNLVFGSIAINTLSSFKDPEVYSADKPLVLKGNIKHSVCHWCYCSIPLEEFAPAGVTIIGQGEIVAQGLQDYLNRHPQMEKRISQKGNRSFFTTDDAADFDGHASVFYGSAVQSEQVHLGE